MEVRQIIRKIAIKNAHMYGKADPKSVIGKVIAEAPEVKGNMKETMRIIDEICSAVNSLTKEEIDREYASYGFVEVKKIEKREWAIPGVKNENVVTRFSPEPNGYLHIGHAKTLIINKMVADNYNGKFYVKFDDTNPKTCRQEFVDAILNDIEWIGIKPDKILFVSDILDDLEKICEKMILNGSAYACTCTQDEIRKNRALGKECKCRKRNANENIKIWNEMKVSLKEGDAIIRFKGDMKSANSVMRDPTLYRIINAKHYRQGKKYRVYPTYDFENPISDALFGINTVLRSKEFELRADLHRALLRAGGFPEIFYYEYARVAIEGYPVSKRLIRPLIENGFLMGYDDPRLVTIAGLRRRGIPPRAIIEFSLSFGLSKLDVNTDLKKLVAETRKYYDPIAKHYFGVAKPKKMIVKDMGVGMVTVGGREVPYSNNFLISEDDFKIIKKGEMVRLKDLKNVKIEEIVEDTAIAKVCKDQQVLRDVMKIQWVDEKTAIKCTFWLIDRPLINEKKNERSLLEIEGMCESNAALIKEHEVVQFERMGFFILDDKKEMRFIKVD
ncbi:MAG: glutamate--tRNA ligase [Candidatus Micrarchaeia archaeon]